MDNLDQNDYNLRKQMRSNIFDKIRDGVIIMDLKGFIVDINKSVEKITGYTREEGLSRSWKDFAPEEVINPLREMFHQNRLLTDFSKISEFKFLHKSGKFIPMECFFDIINDNHGNMEYVVLFIRDIIKRKTFEEKLEKTLDHLNTLSDLLPICANCKKIRDDKGYWEQVETYLQKHSDVKFTHGICPKCAKELYGDLLKD
ncbi:PAS domain S-box protein [Promethearchaeum syntrophicum]|uniref:PAS domain S-box protein n=1 Tax=Promethearchaeum syntrophicum TaxID=2594042 RepID=A0A5B9DEA3_9ARCH|nr:PAS domain S-box protein [Candidatus Prometheoarchaeum syntrophicum]QEE17444.1 sensory histidine kinase AtoS [Candidatus Prometheoarchaeum syntrophicum]